MSVEILFHFHPLQKGETLKGLANKASVVELCKLYSLKTLNMQIINIPDSFNLQLIDEKEVELGYSGTNGFPLIDYEGIITSKS